MILAASEIKQFQDRGFLVLKGFIPVDAIRHVSDWLDRLATAAQMGAAQMGDTAARYCEKSPATGRNMLVRVEHFMEPENAEVSRLLLSPKALGVLTDLLGEEPVLFKEKVNYKLPGCRADKLHQDQSAGWNAYCDFFITMAVAVDENRRDNAALTFLQSGNYVKRLMAPEWQPLTQDDPPYTPADQYGVIEAAPGDVIFFDSYVPHGSPPNLSEYSRRNIYLTFNRRSAGDLRRRYYDDKWASYPPNNLAEAREASAYRV